MGTPQHALHHTILVVDVSGFGGRPEVLQEHVRRGLYAALEAAFGECQLDWAATYHEDRGDGVLMLLPPDAPKSRVVGSLPHHLAAQLRRYNAAAGEDARIRLRSAVTAGEVRHDEHGVVGRDVTLAYRLVESRGLRDAMRGDTLLALIVSERFFDDVIRDDPAFEADTFRRVPVAVKEVVGHAYLHVPNGAQPVAPPPPVEEEPPAVGHGVRRKPRWAWLLAPIVFLGLTDGGATRPPVVPPCPDPVQLNVLVSEEKAEVVRWLAVRFEQDARRNALGCKEVNILVSTGGKSALEVVNALGRAWAGPDDLTGLGAEPHVWLPDSSAEVEAVKTALLGKQRTDLALEDRGPIARSPVVLGASPELAARIDLGDGEFEWQYVDEVARIDLSSGVGLMAAASLAQEGVPTLNFAAPDAARRLREVARTQRDAEPCTGEVAWVTTERQVTGREGCRILYPRQGVLSLNHPFVDVNWLARPERERRREVVDRFHAYLLSPPAQDEFKGDGSRTAAWDVDPAEGARAGRPDELLGVVVDARRLRAAWEQASRAAKVALVADDTPAARGFAAELSTWFGPEDVVERPPPGPSVVRDAARAEVRVVVLLAGRPITRVDRDAERPVRVIGVGFHQGACKPDMELRTASDEQGLRCFDVTDPASRQRAVDGVARAIWGGES